ncbi:MAG: hypothetical protein CMM99_00015 [Rickettsiales bacterium]|nr:hypothetical protein [Rickettsiales bacterium]
MKKIAHLVKNSCNPDWRVIKAAEAGVKNGFKVRVLAMWENGVSPNETINGVEYTRVYPKFTIFSAPKDRLYKQIPSFFGDLLSNLVVSLSQILNRLKIFKHKSVRATAMKRIERGFFKTAYDFLIEYSPDIVHCHDLETLKTGIRAKEKLGCKVIFDSHEFEQNKNPPADELTNSFIRSHEKKFIKKVDSVVTVSNEIAENLKEIYNLSEKPSIIYNIPSSNLINDLVDDNKKATLIDDKLIYRLSNAAENKFENLDDLDIDNLVQDCLKNNYFDLAKSLQTLTKKTQLPSGALDKQIEDNQNLNDPEFEIRFKKQTLSNDLLRDDNETFKSMLEASNRFRNSTELEVKFKNIIDVFRNFEAVGIHVGNLTVGRGIETALRSLEMLPDHALALVGPRNNKSFLSRVHALIDRFDLGERVFFFDSLETNLCEFISYFDYSLVTTLPVSKSTDFSMPNKLFESSIANVPIVCSSTISASMFVKERKRGEVFIAGNEFDIAVKIKKVTDNKNQYIYSEQEQKDFIEEFSQDGQYRKLIDLYNS